MKNTFKLTSFVCGVLIYLVLFYSTAIFAETFEESFEVKLGGKLSIQTDAGSIRIRTHNQAKIELQVKIESPSDDEFTFRHELTNGNLAIIGESEQNSAWGRKLKVEFDLLIPKDYNVELNTSGGVLSIEDLNGELNARTSGGSINVGNIIGDVKLHTSGGSISTGTVTGNLNAHTSGGSINVTIANQLTQDAKLTTSGGSITAYILANIRVDIYASTSEGRVKSDFEIDGKVKKMAVKGKINGGGPKLTLKTSGGSIKIKHL